MGDQLGALDAPPVGEPFPDGSAVRAGDRGWVLVEGDAATSVGAVLAWAQRHGLADVELVADGDGGVAARRAGLFRAGPRVARVEGGGLCPALPAPHPPPLPPPPGALDLVGLLADAGVEIVVEHGEVRGEVLGLEVARITGGPAGAPRVEVGVGRHDRDAFALVHGDVPTARALAGVVDHVRRHRRPGGPAHPLAALAPERWLRSRLVARPGLVGARELEPAEPTVPRDSLKDPAPAVAVGTDLDGAPLVVACSVGIDLDLVPAGADARDRHAPDARLVLVVPPRDDHPATRRLAAALARPAEVATLDR